MEKNKVLLIIAAAVVALALIWFLVLRDTGPDEAGPEPEPVPVEQEQAEEPGETVGAEPEEDQPETALGVEAAAVLASYQSILEIQQQYTDSCPDEATVAEVAGQFDQANQASAALTANIQASDNPQAVEETQSYTQEIEALIQLSATVGPEIVERCGIEVPAEIAS